MRPPITLADDLGALLWSSPTIFVARLDGAGRVLEANPALVAALGQDAVGEPATVLVTGAQRDALAAHLDGAADDWLTLMVGLWPGGATSAEDRLVHVRRAGRETLLVAEPARAERDRLVEQVLRLNDDLIASQRDLGRREREVDRARTGLGEAQQRLGRLEAIVRTGFTSVSLEVALERLLVLARDALGAERAAALLLEEDPRWLRVRAALGMDIAGERTPVGTGVSGAIAATGRGMVFDDIAAVAGLAPEHRRFRGSLAGVPLRLDGAVIGVLHVSATQVGRFGDEDLRLLEAVGERAALAIAHAQLREREARITDTLQRSLLPSRLPSPPGLGLARRYRSRDDGPVGGDFYDALRLPDGRLGLAIGDVAGKGMTAAATMGQVRAAWRAYALEHGEPGAVLDRLDRFVSAMDATATALLVVVEDGGGLLIASAGHPPAVLMHAGGAELVTGALSPPLGSGVTGRGHQRARLAAGGRMLLYTDGLVERRTERLDLSLETLRAVAASAPASLEALCDRVLSALAPDAGWGDDVALLALHRHDG